MKVGDKVIIKATGKRAYIGVIYPNGYNDRIDDIKGICYQLGLLGNMCVHRKPCGLAVHLPSEIRPFKPIEDCIF